MQMYQVYIVQIVSVGGENMFIINVEIIIQLEGDFYVVIGMQIVVVIYIFNVVVYKVWLNSFYGILINWESVIDKIFQILCIVGKVIIYRYFFGCYKVLILIVVCGDSLVFWCLV